MMTWFLLKGLLRDRQRSFFPILVVVCGVMVTVLTYCFMQGISDDLIKMNAKLDTGHVKIMTRGYADISGQLPNDLAVAELSSLLPKLRQDYPDLDWSARIRFGGLIDFPDEQGETRAQGPVIGLAVDLFSGKASEVEHLNLTTALVRGRLPQAPGEILTSETLARNLGVQIGEMATLISATANGSMAIQNFTLVGTVQFGIGMLDKNAMLADLADIQYALDMPDSAGEILGYFPHLLYDAPAADRIAAEFNAQSGETDDEWTPIMLTLRDQNDLGQYLDMMNGRILIIIFVFVFVMSIVLWNTGLMSGLRRYGEMGLRLAFGEAKGHVYWALVYESLLVGFIGSLIGTVLGLAISYYLQVHGFDMSKMMQGSAVLWSNVIRARVTATGYYIGFIPGLLATLLGTLVSGIGIFRRQTSQLFKELET